MKRQTHSPNTDPSALVGTIALPLQDLLGMAWREARQIGEPLLTRMAAGGELLIASVRLVLLVFALPMQLLPLVEPEIRSLALLIHLTLMAWSGLTMVLVKTAYRAWMGRLFSVIDVSLISLGLLALALLGNVQIATDSQILFSGYFFAIGFCGLRYDWRLSFATGLVAMLQYLVLVAGFALLVDVAAQPVGIESFPFWSLQLARCSVMLGATLLVCVIVMRGTHLRRQSMTDGLTGIHNRGYFDRRYAEEVVRARRFERPMAVCLIDVDHFKQINDQFGHPTGDRILRGIAQHLKSATRESDVVARIGGEEFAILFPESDAASVFDRLQRLRTAISAKDWLRRANGQAHPVTVSMGVATYPADGELALNVLDTADERLLLAKTAGRNRIVMG